MKLREGEYLWTQAYRPTTIDEVVIPEKVKSQFRGFIADKTIPNLLLTSQSPGTGKTTTALALCDEIGCKNPMFVNASMDNNIDYLRVKVRDYAMTSSALGNQTKVVILDEVDRLSQQAQEALKGLMELVSKKCRFILTANTKSRIVEPIISRCNHIEFAFDQAERKELMKGILLRMKEILELEGVQYDPKALMGLAQRHFPDNRKMIGALQQYATGTGVIDAGILGAIAEVNTDELVKSMKAKDFGKVKLFCFDHASRMGDDIYDRLFFTMEPHIDPNSVPEVITILGEFQKYHTTVPSMPIQLLSICTHIMMGVKWK